MLNESASSAMSAVSGKGSIRLSFIIDHAVVDHIIAHLRRTRQGLFPPARGSPTPTRTDTTVCRADADEASCRHRPS